MSKKIKIGIADDHPLVITGLRHILGNSADMHIICSYINGKEVLDGMHHQQPDVLLLDIQMPGHTGDELATIIKEQYPAVKIIALTNLDNVYYIRTMLQKGADGYILKTTKEEILLDAIRTVYNGGQYLEPALQEKLTADDLRMKQQKDAAPILSRREKEILNYIAADLTSQQIAETLFISKRTVDNHRLSLLMKLGVKNAAALVKKALQMGLIE